MAKLRLAKDPKSLPIPPVENLLGLAWALPKYSPNLGMAQMSTLRFGKLHLPSELVYLMHPVFANGKTGWWVLCPCPKGPTQWPGVYHELLHKARTKAVNKAEIHVMFATNPSAFVMVRWGVLTSTWCPSCRKKAIQAT